MIKNRVPFDVAWAMADCAEMQPMVLAWIVTFGEMEGGEFDWGTLRWKEIK